MDLPAQKFFEPTANWWKLLAETPWLQYRRHVDVGAGMGHLTDAMVEHGYDCVGLDLSRREGQSTRVEHGNALDRWYESDHCLLIARPCHGGWTRGLWARHCGGPEVLYIGLERNLDTDLDEDIVRELLCRDVGQEGEHVWRVIGPQVSCKSYCLIHPTFWARPSWVVDGELNGEPAWVNDGGAGFYKGDVELEIQDRRWYMHSYQIVVPIEDMLSKREGETNGWIDETGRHYPVDSQNHAAFLARCMGLSEADAERRGWVRCYGGERAFWTRLDDGPASREQKRTLVSLGLSTRDDHEETRTTL